jgi:hypothetical protein
MDTGKYYQKSAKITTCIPLDAPPSPRATDGQARSLGGERKKVGFY